MRVWGQCLNLQTTIFLVEEVEERFCLGLVLDAFHELFRRIADIGVKWLGPSDTWKFLLKVKNVCLRFE